MALDAFLTRLGPARVERWMCESEEALLQARRRELGLLEAIEASLSAQCGGPVILGPPLVPFRALDAADATPLEHLALPVGGGEGLRGLQEAARRALGGAAGHLIAHAPDTGLFLPPRFPTPLEVESVSVGSLPCLEEETGAVLSSGAVGDAVTLAQLHNLRTMSRIALERGLAVELA